MVEFRVRVGDVMVGIYLNGDKGNIVLAAGMPQYLDKHHPFVKQMAKLGINLFIPRYMGTYESSGKFNTENSLKSVETAIRLARQGRARELYANSEISWNPEKIYLYGFSYGALLSLLVEERVDKTILVCPFVSLKYHLPNSVGEDVSKTFEFLERAYPNCYRFRTGEVISDLSQVQLPDEKESLFVIAGREDTSIPKEEVDYLVQKYGAKLIEKDGGHSINVGDDVLLRVLEEN